MLDIQHYRSETPGCLLHNHLNNAGSSLPPLPVIAAVSSYLAGEALHGGYEMAAAKAAEIEGFYAAAAQLIGAKPENIAFVGSATDAFDRAMSSIPFQAGDVLLTTDDDYVSYQLGYLSLQKKLGIRIVRAKKLPEGGVDPQSVKELIAAHRPKLVSVAHVPTNSGLVQDVNAIGQLCEEAGILYLVDACQSAGQLPLDVAAIKCDFLTITYRKWLRGPRGTGFLFVSDRALQQGLSLLLPDNAGGLWTAPDDFEMASSAKRFELWEKNYGLLLGAKAATEYALQIGLQNIQDRVFALAAHAREQFSALPNVRVLDQGSQRCGIVTLHVGGVEPAAVAKALEAANINAGISTTKNAVIDFQEKGVDWALRIAAHYYNMVSEVDEAVAVVRQLVQR